MCLAANIPLLESGTSGYTGQAQPIKRDLVECFDCTGASICSTPRLVCSPRILGRCKRRLTTVRARPPPNLGLLFPQARRFRKLSQSAPSGALRRPRTTASPGQNLTSSRTSLVSRSVPDQNIPSFCWVGVASDWCSLSLISCAYSQLYGADDEADQQELDDAEKNGENGTFPLRPISDSRAVVNAQS